MCIVQGYCACVYCACVYCACAAVLCAATCYLLHVHCTSIPVHCTCIPLQVLRTDEHQKDIVVEPVVVGGNVSQDTQIDKISHPNTCTKYILKNSLRRWAAYPYPSTPFHTVHILGIHQSPASSFISQQCELKAKALEIEREVRILQRIS